MHNGNWRWKCSNAQIDRDYRSSNYMQTETDKKEKNVQIW